ncbi:uncharacterized protein LOC134692878 [Mytilus trossulus]|uniref:uncharacterized protein LOC134692878 n=1 Tax=Mytilus trossulus TaxID=6551 RepID=UPI003005872E
MGRRSGCYNQQRKAERKSLERRDPEVNVFCEGQNPAETKEVKDQADDKNEDTCHWDNYQMALFCPSDQDDQVLFYKEIIKTEFEKRFQTKDTEDTETGNNSIKIEKEEPEPEKKELIEVQEQNRKVGLFVRMTGFLRKKSTSYKKEKKLKQNVRQGKSKDSGSRSFVGMFHCCVFN